VLNPFTENGTDLVNLSTGKDCSAATKHFLLDITEKGESLLADGIQRCVDDPASFIKPKTRQKVMNLSAEGTKVKKKGAERKSKSQDGKRHNGTHFGDCSRQKGRHGTCSVIAIDTNSSLF